MDMENGSSNISREVQISIDDLSMELDSLGLKTPEIKKCSSQAELCESLLSTAWTLINLVHCNAHGLNQNALDREALLQSENQSLESKLSSLKSEVVAKDALLAKGRENIRQLDKELKYHHETIQKQKHQLSQQAARLETQANDYKREIRKCEVESECLREMVRKSIGVGLRASQVQVEKLEDAIGSLSVSSRSEEQAELLHINIQRLKSVNHTLVGENLMLRDALLMIHSDIYKILELAQKASTEQFLKTDYMPESIFRLPLSYCMTKLRDLRNNQIFNLNKLVQTILNKSEDE